MTDYFIALSFVNISTLLLLLVCILTDTVINKVQQKHFLVTVLVVFVICVMEVLSIVFNGASVKYKWIHIVSNYFGFSLTPFVANKLYLLSISCTAQANAPAAFLGSVTTGDNK